MKAQELEIPTGAEGVFLSAVLSLPDEKLTGENVKTLVVMAHDIPFSHSKDHNNLYPFLRTLFDDHQLQTLMFDFEGCGASGGQVSEFSLDTARRNFNLILDWARDKGFAHFMLVGAGITAALCLEAMDKDTKAGFLFWPVVDLASYAKQVKGFSKRFVEQMVSYKPDTAFKSLKVPILIQYGAGEGDSPESAQVDLIKSKFNALRLDITSYAGGGVGLTAPRHRKMIAHHVDQFLHKYA